MKVKVIAKAGGAIKSYRILDADFDPLIHGDIFPGEGEQAYELDLSPDEAVLFEKELEQVFTTFQVTDESGRANLQRKSTR
jgi:hypothetical protein